MFYRTELNDHGLPHDPFKAIVSPRPIAWVSTLNPDGSANLAPYSFFNAFNDTPPMVAFSAGSKKIGLDETKDSLVNARQQGEFTINIVSDALAQQMNISTNHFPRGVDEFEKSGLSKSAGETVKCPFVSNAPAALECKLWKILDLPGGNYHMVIGEVTGIHIRQDLIKEGRYDTAGAQHLARLGYRDYARVDSLFELTRPDD